MNEQYNNYQNNYQNQGVQNNNENFGWDDTILADAKEFILLPEGDYDFFVSNIDKNYFPGSEKMSACNVAKVSIVIMYQGEQVTVTTSLFLSKKNEWKLSEFFTSLGMKKKGEPLKMNWNIQGKKGRCKIETYTSAKDGNKYNNVKRFLPFEAPQYQNPYGNSIPQWQPK